MARRLAPLVMAVALLRASAAFASAPTAPPDRWFGWQVALVDVGASALIAGGGALASTSSGFAFLPALGGMAYFAGGPTVHALNDDPGGAWRSLGLRVGIPIASGAAFAGLAALTARRGTSDLCRSERACAAVFGGVFGFGLGMIGAMVADWVTSSAPARLPPERDPQAVERLTWSVVALPLREGPVLVVAGRF